MTTYTHEFFAMASDCSLRLEVEDAGLAHAAAGAAEAEVRRIEAVYSRYRADSVISKINAAAAAGRDIAVGPETAGLIRFAQACHARSDGAFDVTTGPLREVWTFAEPRLPDPAQVAARLPRIGLDKLRLADGRLGFARPGMEIDFGGVGKEYAADRAARICMDLGVRHGFVNLAGDIRVIGPQPDGAPWRFGVRHPREPEAAVGVFELSEGALATSGDYERFFEIEGRRFCHILDPRTGWPARGLSSVSVVAGQCLVAGALATAAMVLGRSGAAWLAGLAVSHLVVDEPSVGVEPLVVTC
ncbi:FAD:protein FMN transferase [Phenylobacterium sp.]|uniref:FAD:protein FMN transferase n=1 Tax=Phenylobacterium sp. TaxID=1871053 RepID=UPI0035AFDAE2